MNETETKPSAKPRGKKSKNNDDSDLPIAVIDAETDPFRHGRVPAPFIWGFYDGSTYLEFDKTEDMVAHIREFEGIVYAHNGGKFDFHFILEHIERGEPIMLINGRIVKASIGKCQIRDSYALLPAPLSAYKKDEIDYSIMEKRNRNKPENRAKIRTYLRGDCVYLYDMIMGFFREHGMALTQAGAAMKKWEEIDEAKAPQSNGKFFKEFSQFYYGGRVEVFKAGHIKKPLKLYDIKSAYPRAMLDKHPYGLHYKIITNPDLERIKPTSFVEVECVSRGGLPFRDGNKIVFPDDGVRRTYFATGHEFLASLEIGLISDFRILRTIDFILEKDFRKYIEPLYELKALADTKIADIKAGKNVLETLEYWQQVRLFAKLLMNSLYGKFGANPDNYGHYLLAADDYQLTDYEGYELYATFDNIHALSKPLSEMEQRYYNVATAASITGWVRAYLLRNIYASSGVVYCDTDSLLCEAFGGVVGDQLGDWNHEADISEAWIAGKKMYALKLAKKSKEGWYKTAHKGVVLTPGEIKKMVQGETVTFKSQAPTFSLKKKPTFTPRNVKMLDEVKAKVLNTTMH